MPSTVVVTGLSSRSQPIAGLYTRKGEQDSLGLTVWRGKKDPTAEIPVAQIRRRIRDSWETIGRLAV